MLFFNKETELLSLKKGFSSKFVYQLGFLLITQPKFERASFLYLVPDNIRLQFDYNGNGYWIFFCLNCFCFSIIYFIILLIRPQMSRIEEV